MSQDSFSSAQSSLKTEGNRELTSAAQKGDLGAVRRALQTGKTNPDATSKCAGQDRSPLHIACGYGQHIVVAELLRAGADPCALSSAGRTALHDSCQGGYSECVELLVDFDVDVDCQDRSGMAPIHIAAFQGELECFVALAEKGADLRLINAKGQEPSHLAVQRNHVSIIKYLFEKSIDLEATCFQGRQPLHYAAQYGALDCVIALVERNCDIDIGDNGGCIPAHLAAKMNQVDCLRFLVKQGCTLDTVQNEGKTFAHMAAQAGSHRCLHWLLEKGFDPNITDDYGNTVGHSATENSHAECFNCYVQHRGSLKAVNNKGETAIQAGRRAGIPLQVEKAVRCEIQCPQCTLKNKKYEWDMNHQLAPVETAIKQVGQAAYSNPVTFSKPPKEDKPRAHKPLRTENIAPAQASRQSRMSNFSGLFITDHVMPARDITTKYYGSYLHDHSQSTKTE